MMNEQLSWLTPFSQQVAPGLAWRSKDRKEQKEKLSGFAPLREITFSSTYVI